MEMTKEIRANLFYQYYGKAYTYKNDFGTYQETVGNINTHKHLTEYEVVKLILKPLSSITDKEAIEVAKMFNSETLGQGREILRCFLTNEKMLPFTPNKIIELYQYLQSQGYDFRQHSLEGKTLQESGLAIYKK